MTARILIVEDEPPIRMAVAAALRAEGFEVLEAADGEEGERTALRELAELWRPGVPITDVPEYVARARALNSGLEMELTARQQASERKKDAS